MHRLPILALLLLVLAGVGLGPGTVLAIGGGGAGGPSSASAESGDWTKAKRAIAAKDYDAAVPLLKQVVQQDPKNADAYNYLGYAHARSGKSDAALGYYKQALALKPEHRGANEYLGDLYLKLGDLAAAEERLAVLDKACLFGCVEYDLLKEAVQKYKATGKFSSGKGL